MNFLLLRLFIFISVCFMCLEFLTERILKQPHRFLVPLVSVDVTMTAIALKMGAV